MKRISKHIYSIIIAILCAFVMESCIYDRGSDCDGIIAGTQDTNPLLLVLHISPVDTRALQQITEEEKIKTLRIIILNDGKLECNKLIEINNPGPLAAHNFQYIFTWPTVAGEKKFYFIANEESVNKIQYQSAEELPNIQSRTLSDLLSSYEPDLEKDTDFEKVMKSIYFSPTYTPDENGDIYLPYTTVYEGFEAKKDQHLGELKMYLVPVATKFTFKFINKRSNDVRINEISVSSVNTENFLFANIGDNEKYKEFEQGKKLYWIDWLAKIAEESHKNEGYYDNENFNNKYGWILDYNMPTTTQAITAEFVNSGNAKEIKGTGMDLENLAAPGELTLGAYYVPESQNKNPKEEDVTEQHYDIKLDLQDVTEGEIVPNFNESLTISNLKSLFRNTSVVITITMSEGTVEAYAEIADWNKKSAYGWVTD